MKKYLYIFFASCLSLSYSVAQQISPGSAMPSANASRAVFGANNPTGLHTGQVSIGLPICELTSGSLSTGVSLSYNINAKSKKLPWSGMQGLSVVAGGVITRTVKGLPDEYDIIGVSPRTGYKNQNYMLQQIINDCNLRAKAATMYIDTEPDVYSFSFGGRSGKFTISKEGRIYLMPYQELKIEFLPDNKILVKDEGAVVYEFGGIGAVELSTTNRGFIGGAGDLSQQYVSAYYITSITAPNQDNIAFEYEDAGLWKYEHTDYFRGQGLLGSSLQDGCLHFETNIQEINLKSIQVPSSKLVFETIQEVTNALTQETNKILRKIHLFDNLNVLQKTFELGLQKPANLPHEYMGEGVAVYEKAGASSRFLGMITSNYVLYPTGGYTKYVYEPHEYYPAGDVSEITEATKLLLYDLNFACNATTNFMTQRSIEFTLPVSRKVSFEGLVREFSPLTESMPHMTLTEVATGEISFSASSYKIEKVLQANTRYSFKVYISPPFSTSANIKIEASIKALDGAFFHEMPVARLSKNNNSSEVEVTQILKLSENCSDVDIEFAVNSPTLLTNNPAFEIFDETTNTLVTTIAWEDIKNNRGSHIYYTTQGIDGNGVPILVYTTTLGSAVVNLGAELKKDHVYICKIYNLNPTSNAEVVLNARVVRSGNLAYGGQRIAHITVSDGVDPSKNIVKRYEYTDFESLSGKSSGVLSVDNINFQETYFKTMDYQNGQCNTGDFHLLMGSAPENVFVNEEMQAYVGYTHVTEIQGDTSKIEYKFNMEKDAINQRMPYATGGSNRWKSGLLQSKTVWNINQQKEFYKKSTSTYQYTQYIPASFPSFKALKVGSRIVNIWYVMSQEQTQGSGFSFLSEMITDCIYFPENNEQTNPPYSLPCASACINDVGLDNMYPYQLYNVYSAVTLPTGSTETTYFENSSPITTTTNILYHEGNSKRHIKPIEVRATNSEGETVRQITKYVADYANFPNVPSNSIANGYKTLSTMGVKYAPVEQFTVVEKPNAEPKLTGASFYTYKKIDIQNSGSIAVLDKQFALPVLSPLPVSFMTANNLVNGAYHAAYEPTMLYEKYSPKGRLLQQRAHKGQPTSIIYDYHENVAVAQVGNAEYEYVGYASFDADGKGNWQYTGNHIKSEQSALGTGYYKLDAQNSITLPLINTDVSFTFKVSFWARGNATITINQTPIQINAPTWTYYEKMIDVLLLSGINISSNVPIDFDEARAYPANSFMKTISLKPLVGILAETDDNGESQYYEYDVFNRIRAIRNKKKQVVKTYEYKQKIN